VVAAEKNLTASKTREKSSYNGVLPNLTLSSGYRESSGENPNPWSAQATAGWDLFRWKNFTNIQRSVALTKRSFADQQWTLASLRYDLRWAFTNLVYAQEGLAVAQHILDIREQNAHLVQLKYESGRESKGNMLQAQAEHADAEATFRQTERDVVSAREEMNRQMGTEDPTLVANGFLDPQPTLAPTTLETITLSHPQTVQAQLDTQLATVSLRDAWDGVFPSLSLAYTKSLDGPHYFPDTENWNFSGLVSWSFFSGGPATVPFAISAARRDLEGAQEKERAVRLQVKSTLVSSLSNAMGTFDQVQVQTQFLNAARQRNDEATIRYSNGLISFEIWESVVTNLVNREQSALRALRDAVVAQASWEKAMGKLLEDQ